MTADDFDPEISALFAAHRDRKRIEAERAKETREQAEAARARRAKPLIDVVKPTLDAIAKQLETENVHPSVSASTAQDQPETWITFRLPGGGGRSHSLKFQARDDRLVVLSGDGAEYSVLVQDKRAVMVEPAGVTESWVRHVVRTYLKQVLSAP